MASPFYSHSPSPIPPAYWLFTLGSLDEWQFIQCRTAYPQRVSQKESEDINSPTSRNMRQSLLVAYLQLTTGLLLVYSLAYSKRVRKQESGDIMRPTSWINERRLSEETLNLKYPNLLGFESVLVRGRTRSNNSGLVARNALKPSDSQFSL